MVKIVGDAAYLRLTQRASHDKWAHSLVDLEDYERVIRSKWHAVRGGKSFYATATTMACLPKHHARLHAFIMRVEPGQIVDHINGDTLDNRKQNLRIVDAAANAKNARRPTFPGKTSRFKGICWSRHDGKWLARITSDRVTTDLGMFDDEVMAARAYDQAALELHREFARTNETMRLYEQADPFVPDCSKALDFDGHVRMPLSRAKNPRLSPRNYKQRLDDKLRAEIAAFVAKN